MLEPACFVLTWVWSWLMSSEARLLHGCFTFFQSLAVMCPSFLVSPWWTHCLNFMMNSLSELHVLLWPPGLGSSEIHATNLSLPSFLHVSYCFSVLLPERSTVLHSSAQLWTSGGPHILDHQVKAGWQGPFTPSAVLVSTAPSQDPQPCLLPWWFWDYYWLSFTPHLYNECIAPFVKESQGKGTLDSSRKV